jgi:predicted transcriptional regulator
MYFRNWSVDDWLAARGGRAQTSMRRLAREIGRSPSGVHDEIGRLVASGAITVPSGPRGSVLALRAH